MIARNSAPYLGVLLEYPQSDAAVDPLERQVTLGHVQAIAAPRVAVIGAGNFAGLVLLPALREAGAALHTLTSARGFSAATLGRKFGFAKATTDVDAVLGDAAVDAVVIATRHDNHAELTARALDAGKHVFVEKPLALDHTQLERVIEAYQKRQAAGRPALVMVGFNRRFASHVVKMKAALQNVAAPKAFVMTVNAGAIPRAHWVHERTVGGGRIIGEGCHFIDLLRFLAGSPIDDIDASALYQSGEVVDDVVTITLRFKDGSVGSIHYFANGHKGLAKERLEVFCGGKVLQLDNFRTLSAHGFSGLKTGRSLRQDKGHDAELLAFVRALQSGGPSPIPFDELVEVTRASFEVDAKLRGRCVRDEGTRGSPY